MRHFAPRAVKTSLADRVRLPTAFNSIHAGAWSLVFPHSNVTIDAGGFQARRGGRIDQEMINSQAGDWGVGVSEIVPERGERLIALL